MTEDQNPRSESGPGDGQLLTDIHREEALISTEGSADPDPDPDTESASAGDGPEEPASVSHPPSATAPRLRRWLTTFLVVSGLVVCAAGGTVAVEQQRSREARGLKAAEQGQLNWIRTVRTASDVVTKTTTTPTGARLTAAFSAAHISALLTYRGLPPLPARRTYEVFRVRNDKTKPMRILASGELSGTALILGVGNGDALVFTVEPEGGSGSPTGPVAVGLRLS